MVFWPRDEVACLIQVQSHSACLLAPLCFALHGYGGCRTSCQGSSARAGLNSAAELIDTRIQFVRSGAVTEVLADGRRDRKSTGRPSQPSPDFPAEPDRLRVVESDSVAGVLSQDSIASPRVRWQPLAKVQNCGPDSRVPGLRAIV